MAIVGIFYRTKRPFRFMSREDAEEAMKRRRTGPYKYEQLPQSNYWIVVRRIDKHTLCTDGLWRHILNVDLSS